MTLTLARKPVAPEYAHSRLDLFGIVPDRLLSLDVVSIHRLPVQVDGCSCTVDDCFEVIDGPRDGLSLTGDLSNADRVGGGMRLGMLSVASSVGTAVAAEMRQGDLHILGSAGDYACSQMRGGRVRIGRNVGDYCAAAEPGSRRGMRGGSCVVEGSAGRFLGYRMRRGTLIVRGDVGEGCASSMIAGSILIGGSVAAPLGVAMQRGSLILFDSRQPKLPIGFTPLEQVRLSYLPLLLGESEPDLPPECRTAIQNGNWLRSLGDRASHGMGEVIWLRPKDEEVLQ